MKHSRKKLVLAFVAAVMLGIPCMAQDVEPPFTWEGKGSGSFISEGGTEDINFQFELSIDEQGMFKGQTSNEDGTSKIKHVFYTEPKQYDFPGFFSRKLVIILLINEYGDNPMLSVLNGRVLVDRFLYGEIMLTGYEEGSDTARALGVGNPEATLMEGDELPDGLKSALKKCLPFGMVKIEGDYKEEETSAAARQRPRRLAYLAGGCRCRSEECVEGPGRRDLVYRKSHGLFAYEGKIQRLQTRP
jgi:hypothetical protein